MQHDDYDITAAFQAIEDELIASMIRNMDRHRAEETKEGYEWSMWQAEQLKALEKYKRENQKKYGKQFQQINQEIEELIRQARVAGGMEQELKILKAIKNGFKGAKKVSRGAAAEFFRLNDRKLEALIEATTHDMERAETAILRKANDDYRKAIFNAQVYANTGAGTYEKAVDMATKDMLSRGLNCVVYANGARHTLADYADMALRTAGKRAYLQGEGEKRQEWGISTVIVNKRGNPCPKCLPFCGKVLIDDVWSGGKKSDGPYPLMSTAIEYGLYHPRCRDSHTTYFPGISTADDTWTRKELEGIKKENQREGRLQYASRQAGKYARLAKFSLDPENRKEYARRAREWNEAAAQRFRSHEELSDYMKTRYNGSVDDDVKQLNLGQVSQTLTEFERVLEDFSSAAEFFTGINVAERGKAAFVPDGELVLSPRWYGARNAKLVGTGYHEAGHLLELALIRKDNPGASEEIIFAFWKNRDYARNAVKKAFGRIRTGKSLKELRQEISDYSLKDFSETLAEAVEDFYMNGYGSSVLSRQIMKVLEEELT